MILHVKWGSQGQMGHTVSRRYAAGCYACRGATRRGARGWSDFSSRASAVAVASEREQQAVDHRADASGGRKPRGVDGAGRRARRRDLSTLEQSRRLALHAPWESAGNGNSPAGTTERDR